MSRSRSRVFYRPRACHCACPKVSRGICPPFSKAANPEREKRGTWMGECTRTRSRRSWFSRMTCWTGHMLARWGNRSCMHVDRILGLVAGSMTPCRTCTGRFLLALPCHPPAFHGTCKGKSKDPGQFHGHGIGELLANGFPGPGERVPARESLCCLELGKGEVPRAIWFHVP